jgi:FixJ family two-component response regulator
VADPGDRGASVAMADSRPSLDFRTGTWDDLQVANLPPNPESSQEAGGGIVHVVDDDAELRAALIRLMRSDGLAAVGHSDAAALLSSLHAEAPCCVVLDVRLSGESGLAIQDVLRDGGSTVPIIFLTGYGTIPMSVQAMRGGASEFLTKPVEDDVLLSAIRRALNADLAAVADRRVRQELEERFGTLTSRERQVMALAIGGLMNKQIAAGLGVTEITAKVHKRQVMEKMEARSLPDLVRMAELLGIPATLTR